MTDARLQRCAGVDDVRKLARRTLPLPIFDMIDGGSADEVTLRRNVAAFDEIELIPRVGRDVSEIETRTRVLGTDLSFPLILAPTGVQGVIHVDAELAPARAASKAGLMYSLSTFATASLEEVADACPGAKMFQLYVLNDQATTDELVERARAAGYNALCITIDVPVNSGMERMARWGINPVGGLPPLDALLAMALRPAWSLTQGRLARKRVPDVVKRLASRGVEIKPDFFDTIIRKDLTWDDIRQIVRRWDGPVAIKGIISAEDAVRAADVGATAVIACNHGGLSLDGAPPTISVIAGISEAVGNRLEVIHCGGVRRGHSIVKALGLGATAAMVGRPFLYGLAAAGEEGVAHVLTNLRREFETTMRLCGATALEGLDASILGSHGTWARQTLRAAE